MSEKKEIFADGIGQIHFAGGMVRFDFVTLQPTEDGKAPVPLDQDQFSAYISSLNPKRIVVIGDSSIVSPEYRLAIDKKYEVIDFASKSWVVTAISAANLFNTGKIRTKFEEKRAVSAQPLPSTAPEQTSAPEAK